MAGKSGGIGKTFVWILMGLLFVGLAGFGATNLSGTVRTVGSVGEKSISTDDYFRAVQQELRALSAQTGQAVSFREAQDAGIIDGVIARLVTTAALDHEASEMGLSISDARLGQEIVNLPAFQGIDGSFDREGYRMALENNGFSESEFEQDLRDETARTLLQASVLTGNKMPESFTNVLLNFAAETRDFSYARVGEEVLEAPVAAPTEGDLESYHAENQARYTVPQTRNISYAWITPEMLLDTVEVDEATLRAEYEANRSTYIQPERRLVERLIMGDEAAADAARARIDTGEITFEALVEERGLALSDVDLGDQSRADLGEAADAVFSAEEGQVVGPLPSDLGPALFRVNTVIAALETSFEEAEPLLRETLAQDRARRAVDNRAQDFDDLLAGGATLEQLADETEMAFGQIGWTALSGDDIAAYDAFREAAAAATLDDFPEILDLGDGGLFAMRLDEIVEPRPQPLDEVRDQVIADWTEAATQDAITAIADDMAAKLGEGATFEGLGLTAESRTGQGRRGILIDLPSDMLARVFETAAGDVATLPGMGTEVLIFRVDAVTAPDTADAETAALQGLIADRVEGQLAQDLFEALARDVQSRAGLQLDQQALNAVNANFP